MNIKDKKEILKKIILIMFDLEHLFLELFLIILRRHGKETNLFRSIVAMILSQESIEAIRNLSKNSIRTLKTSKWLKAMNQR